MVNDTAAREGPGWVWKLADSDASAVRFAESHDFGYLDYKYEFCGAADAGWFTVTVPAGAKAPLLVCQPKAGGQASVVGGVDVKLDGEAVSDAALTASLHKYPMLMALQGCQPVDGFEPAATARTLSVRAKAGRGSACINEVIWF
jgi:hypothetical protein